MKLTEFNDNLKGMLAICGKQGSGKTLLASLLAYADFKKGRNIYSNYPLSFDHIPIDCLEVIKNAKDGTVLLDEAYQLADARKSTSKKNVVITTILAKARKHRLRYIFIQQYWRTVDVRIRTHADWILFPAIYSIDEENQRPESLRVKIFTRDDTGSIILDDIVILPLPEIAFHLYDTEADVYEFKDEKKKGKGVRKLDEFT